MIRPAGRSCLSCGKKMRPLVAVSGWASSDVGMDYCSLKCFRAWTEREVTRLSEIYRVQREFRELLAREQAWGLELPDTPEEIREDATGWTQPTEPEDVGFPVVQYTDEDIDKMLIEENEIVKRNARPRLEDVVAVTNRPFKKPLSMADALLIELVCKRYTGMDAPFIKVETETEVILRIPPGVRRKSYDEQVSS